MFVVTGLHTKRRSIRIDKRSSTTKEQCVEKARLPPAAQHPHQHPRTKPFSSPSPRRVSEPMMTRNDSDKNAWNRHEKSRRPPTKFSLGRQAPPRVRRFIPKPLILVERMKARQLLLQSSATFGQCTSSESLNRSMTAVITPLSVLVTPPAQRTLRCTILSSDSQSFGSVSFRISSRKSRNGFGMTCRSFSDVGLDDSSSTADTSVGDSPCCMKQGSNPPALLMETNSAKVHVSVKFDPKDNRGSDTGIAVLIDSVAGDFMPPTSCSNDIFKPTMTSTPFASSRGNAANVPSPAALIPSTAYPTDPSEQTSRCFHGSEVVMPTSQAVFPFNVPNSAYIVKLPNALPAIPHSDKTRLVSALSAIAPYPQLSKPRAPLMSLSNAPDPHPPSGLKRPPSRVSCTSPALVLDGVFALPHPPSSLSSFPLPRQMLPRFPRPRKPPRSHRPTLLPCDPIPYAPRSEESSPSPSSRGQLEPESPRSKLARVLNAHVEPQMRPQRRQGNGRERREPRLVRADEAGTQCKIGRFGASGDGHGSGDGNESGGDGRGTTERVAFAGVGMVARLRARWERSGAPLR